MAVAFTPTRIWSNSPDEASDATRPGKKKSAAREAVATAAVTDHLNSPGGASEDISANAAFLRMQPEGATDAMSSAEVSGPHDSCPVAYRR